MTEANTGGNGQNETLSQSVIDQYVNKLEKIFNVDPPKILSLRKANAILNGYKSQNDVSEVDIALFHLHYAEMLC